MTDPPHQTPSVMPPPARTLSGRGALDRARRNSQRQSRPEVTGPWFGEGSGKGLAIRHSGDILLGGAPGAGSLLLNTKASQEAACSRAPAAIVPSQQPESHDAGASGNAENGSHSAATEVSARRRERHKKHRVLPREWELTQCLFGEHLLKKYPDKQVCLVEAEKTAIIGAALMPQFVWVAVGDKTQLGDKVEILEGRTIIAFPDVDGYDKWMEKCGERLYLNIQVSDYLQQNATEEDKQIGADIADVLIRWKLDSTSYVTAKQQEPPPITLYNDNPVMREVLKCISPEYWDETDVLIRELDMEFVGVTRNVQPINKSNKYDNKSN